MAKISRRGFLGVAGSIPVFGAVFGRSAYGRHEPQVERKRHILTEPKREHRAKLRYMAIRTQVTMQELGIVIPQLHREVYAWLKKRGNPPSGPPFIRFIVIDMASKLDVELGVPVGAALTGGSRVCAGVLPAGHYSTLVYTGVANGIYANEALQKWAAKRGIEWQTRSTKKGTEWVARAEFFLTDPKDEPDMQKWRTEVAYLEADNKTR